MGTEQYSAAGNVRVLARVRPALSHEYQYDQAVEVLSVSASPAMMQLMLHGANQQYSTASPMNSGSVHSFRYPPTFIAAACYFDVRTYAAAKFKQQMHCAAVFQHGKQASTGLATELQPQALLQAV